MRKSQKNKLDLMVKIIENMPEDSIEQLEKKDDAVCAAIKLLVRTLPDFEVDGVHYQTLENIGHDIDDKIDRYESDVTIERKESFYESELT